MNEINHLTISSSSSVLRPTQVEVNLSRLRQNFCRIRDAVAPAKMMPILKANAYGHGLVRVAGLMQELKADYIGVAVLEEGLLLRESGITMPILIMGGVFGNQIPYFIQNDLTITASSVAKLKNIDEAARDMRKKAKVHLKIDTGMERIGVHYYNAEEFIRCSLDCSCVEVEGIYTHFANADAADLSYTILQLDRFKHVLSHYERLNTERPPLIHAANSGAILQASDSFFNMVRPGILLYGVYPSADVRRTIAVQPALTWKSRVVYFKVILPDHPVGYGSTWQSNTPVRAVTVPVGYGDGYLRSMSQYARVIIRGKQYPVIGSISMDQIVVNIDNDSAFNNDEVILVGESEGTLITVEDLAEWAKTIPYEILTNINTRVPRTYSETD
ncbi:MAG: alanine racemase [Calditrichaeota bacterium]|nr:MAG: alanine racemase [Calditrichota bacterium]